MSNRRRKVNANSVQMTSHSAERFEWYCRRCDHVRVGMSSPDDKTFDTECFECGKRVRVILRY